MFVSRGCVMYSYVVGFISGGWKDYYYRVCLFSLLLGFLCLRLPYVYGMGGFGLFLVFFMAPLFLSLFLSRVLDLGPSSFFCEFVPLGTPLWMAPFICLAETLSYLVRPVVLMIRPFVNLTMGALGGAAMGAACLKFGMWALLFLVVLFFYEVFVALVHWFIVCKILSFSEKH